RVRVGAGNAVLDAQPRALAAETEAARAIVPARDDPRRRERSGLVPLERVDRRRVEVRELARTRDLPREPLAEERRAGALAVRSGTSAFRPGGEERLLPGAIPQRRMEMERRSGGAGVVLRHERHRASLEMRDLLRAVLVERGAI